MGCDGKGKMNFSWWLFEMIDCFEIKFISLLSWWVPEDVESTLKPTSSEGEWDGSFSIVDIIDGLIRFNSFEASAYNTSKEDAF